MWAKKMAKAQRPEAAEHMWGHLRRLRVCRVEEGEVGEAGLDRQRQVVCARLGRVHFTPSIGFTSLHLASWSPESQRPLFLQTDVSTWIIPEHTCSEQGRKKGLSLCFLIAPWQEEAAWQGGNEALGSGSFGSRPGPSTAPQCEPKQVILSPSL